MRSWWGERKSPKLTHGAGKNARIIEMSISRYVAPFGLLILLAAPAMPQDRTMFPPVRGTHQMIGAGKQSGGRGRVPHSRTGRQRGGRGRRGGADGDGHRAGSHRPGRRNAAADQDGRQAGDRDQRRGRRGREGHGRFLSRIAKPEPWEDRDTFPPIPGVGIRAAITPGPGRRAAAGARKIRHHVLRASGGAGDRATRTAFRSTEIFSQYLTAEPAHSRASCRRPRNSIFPNGTVPKPGEMVHMPDLARTLREMAAAEKKAHGNRAAKIRAVHDYFYKGSHRQAHRGVQRSQRRPDHLRRSGEFPRRDGRSRAPPPIAATPSTSRDSGRRGR